jgi:putative peptide zinc metalloprotease protein
MSETIAAQDAVSNDRRLAAPEPPRLLPGTELMGQVAGSGLRDAPYLVRRRDGEVVQLSQLLYVIAGTIDGRDLDAVADTVGARPDLRVTPEQVAYVAEQKLAPLGLVAYQNGSTTRLERINPLLALRYRVGVVPERTVNKLAGWLRPLFLPPVVVAALAALLACDVWVGSGHGIGAGLRTVIHRPVLGLALFATMILSLAFHECGHAAACRYGGAQPGRIGIGIYLVWPVFYTDVTDSYRLTKAGRLRTDLGGVYFNALVALVAAGAYFATGYEPLLIVVVTQQLLLLDQFVPWVRLDGYHIVSDLIGVSDLFARIKPVITSLLPGRHPDPRVTELKPWARAAVTTWVFTTVLALAAMATAIIVYGPGYLGRAERSLLLQLDEIRQGLRVDSVVDFLTGTIGTVMLILPVAGITLTYVLLCRHAGTWLALRGASGSKITPAAAHGDETPQPGPMKFLGRPQSPRAD